MNLDFSPVIDKKSFGERILAIQSNEGNSFARMIGLEINGHESSHLFEVFMNACERHHITLKSSEKEHQDKKLYEVSILVNNLNHSSILYQSPGKDITRELADELYSVLGQQLKNELFIEEIKATASKSI